MMIDPFSSTAPASVAWSIGASAEIAGNDIVSDNEAGEFARTAKAPLQPYQGTIIDAQA